MHTYRKFIIATQDYSMGIILAEFFSTSSVVVVELDLPGWWLACCVCNGGPEVTILLLVASW
jgi:hypothetical protein